MNDTIFSLIPPILVIVTVLLSKKVIPSISIGIVTSALLIHNFDIIATLENILEVFVRIFYVDGAINISNIYLISFLLLLGVLTSFITKMGGTQAFAYWSRKHVKNKYAAQLMAFFLGIIIFIDDYFNALTVGEISRPLVDQYKVSREKLAYIIDSTSAPVCVISPISSWGAYIIALLSMILVTYGIKEAPFMVFFEIIPYNFYAIFSLIFVFAVIMLDINIGKIKYRDGTLNEEDDSYGEGQPSDLLLPIGLLIFVTVFMIFFTGYLECGSLDFMEMLKNSNTYLSLLLGSVVALIVVLNRYRKTDIKDYKTPMKQGFRAMLPAVTILIFAWALIDLISEIGTGTYLSTLFASLNFNSVYLPLILFIISGFMALATGTSWGTFGVMLPIGAQMAMNLNPDLFLVCLGAVLSGSVFGDHCSPISDTTILSSTGAKCHHIDHVMSQLPYALSTALVSAVGFLVAGFTESILLSLIASTVTFIIVISLLKVVAKKY